MNSLEELIQIFGYFIIAFFIIVPIFALFGRLDDRDIERAIEREKNTTP